MKIKYIQSLLFTLCLFLYPSTQLVAQCGPASTPSVEIGDKFITANGYAYVPIIAHNFNNVTYWNMSFCMSGSSKLSVNGVFNQWNGQFINLDNSGKVTIAWGNPTLDCSNSNGAFANNTILAYIRVKALSSAYCGNSATIVMCDNAPSAPSHVVWCAGNALIETEPPFCSGTVTVNKKSKINVYGRVRNINGGGISGVQVKNSATSTTSYASSSGWFSIFNLPTYSSSISVTPQPNAMAFNMNGIDQADIQAIQDHILGSQTLNCMQRIAADVNGSGTITGLDQLLIQKAILFNGYANVGDWKFIPTNYNVGCSGNSVPSGYPSSYVITNYCSSAYTNFTGIKLGDVTGNATMKTSAEPEAAPVANSVSVSPNPFIDLATLNIEQENPGTAEVRIYDLSGKLLYSTHEDLLPGTTQIQLDARSWPSGLLMYQVITTDEKYSGRMVHTR